MLVRKWMSTEPTTIQVGEPLTRAILLMKDNGVRHLPVMDGKKLVGVVSDRDLKEYSPSAATTLDIYELHYLLAKATVKKVMRKNPQRVTPEESIERAALLMHDNGIGCLMVVDPKGTLVGILTHADVFEALVRMTGCRSDTTRLQMTIPDEAGSIKVVADKARAHGRKILSILTSALGVPAGKRELILRVEGGGRALEDELRKEYPDLIVHQGC